MTVMTMTGIAGMDGNRESVVLLQPACFVHYIHRSPRLDMVGGSRIAKSFWPYYAVLTSILCKPR